MRMRTVGTDEDGTANIPLPALSRQLVLVLLQGEDVVEELEQALEFFELTELFLTEVLQLLLVLLR